MDQQPKFNRILNYKPETNRAVREIAPGQYAMCGVINSLGLSDENPGMPEYLKSKGGNWHSGRSIRVDEMGDQDPPVGDLNSPGVFHRNCMWFDVEIDKQYLMDYNITHLDTILRGNISDNMIHSAIWWPVDQGQPIYQDRNVSVGPDAPLDPSERDLWAETEYTPSPSQDDVIIRVWEYQLGEDDVLQWVIIFGSEASQQLYNTTTINNIPTYVMNPELKCRFIVQVHWNMKLSNTVTPREMALYVFNGSQDATRELDDYIVKSPIVKMRNQANPGAPNFDEPTQKGFVPAEMFEYYDNPRGKNIVIPITETEIVMDVLSGTALIDPPSDYEDAVNIDMVGDNASLEIHVGAGSEAWVMIPVDDGVYQGNFPYYIGDREESYDVVTGETEYTYMPTKADKIYTFQGPGRYSIYGPNAIVPTTPQITQWLIDNDFPKASYEPLSLLTDVKFQGSRGFNLISNWEGIIQTTGQRLFADTTGDIYLPEYQTISDLTEIFAGNPDFTDTADALNTWITTTATSMEASFADCVNYNKNPEFNTSNITNMRNTFKGCINFNTDINTWDVSSVTDMFGMFKGCENFNQPLGAWLTSSVLNMGDMFSGCSIYDQFIATWDVENIINKPPGFDTGTISEWTDFEKPWWGRSERPETFKYITLDVKRFEIMLKYQGDTHLQIFNFDRSHVITLSQGSGSNRTLIPTIKPIAVFGHTDALGFTNSYVNAIIQGRAPDMLMHDTNYWQIMDGYSISVGKDYRDPDDTYQTPSLMTSDIDNHLILKNIGGGLDTILDIVQGDYGVLGDNNNWDDLYSICSGLTAGAFEYMGRLPNDLPLNLKFGWQGMTDQQSSEITENIFAGCSNLPPSSITDTWIFDINPDNISLKGAFGFMPNSINLASIIKRILDQTQRADATLAHCGSRLSDLNIATNQISTEITNLTSTYRYADLSQTQGLKQLCDLDTYSCASWREAFMFSTGTNTFVSDHRQNMAYTPGIDLSYEFAYTTLRPDQITDWNFNDVDNISCMFYKGMFPDQIDNVDLSNINRGGIQEPNGYGWDELTPQNITHKVDHKQHHVFTGCLGNPSSMVNWKLPHPQGVRFRDKVFYRDVMMPWWFAGCIGFNADISSWQTTDPIMVDGAIEDDLTRKHHMSIVRVGTFALAENFNSAMPWFFPEEMYYPLSENRAVSLASQHETVRYTQYMAQINKPFAESRPSNVYLYDTQIYGEVAPQQVWWRTFLNAKKYNNGNQPIPTILASDMVDTFRSSGIDQDVTIRKPIWGKAYYQGVFEDTTSWTAPRVIDFECQNRLDTPGLENVYYHAILAQRMFKNSTFMGNLGPGFKWFFYNVTNVNGCHYSALGLNKEYTSWSNYAELQDLRSREQAGTLSEVQTDTLTDSFGTWPVYNGNAMRSTNYGPRRAPQGNIIDAEATYSDQATDRPDIIIGYPAEQMNSGLVDMTLPPVQERFMANYAVWPLWTSSSRGDWNSPDSFNIYDDRSWFSKDEIPAFEMRNKTTGRSSFGYYNAREGRTPIEMSNLSEMFMNCGNFTQDLSMFITRWSPPSGALTDTQSRDWRDDGYFGSGIQKPDATFGRRAHGPEITAPDFSKGKVVYTASNPQSVGDITNSIDISGVIHWADDFPPGYIESLPEYFYTGPGPQYIYSDKLAFVISPYEIRIAKTYNDTNSEVVEYETFMAMPNSIKSFDFQGFVNGKLNFLVKDIPAVMWENATADKWIISDIQIGASIDLYRLYLITDTDTDPSTLLPGSNFTPNSQEELQGAELLDSASFQQVWLPYDYLSDYTPDKIYDIDYLTSQRPAIQNGHEYNNFGDSKRSLNIGEFPPGGSATKFNSGPEKSDMDVLFVDNYVLSPALIETSAWHGYKHTPTDFAIGAQNFTPDKWPTWMVGYSDYPQSITSIDNHFQPTTNRNIDAGRYITNYAWIHEPYNWPDGDIYRNGDY